LRTGYREEAGNSREAGNNEGGRKREGATVVTNKEEGTEGQIRKEKNLETHLELGTERE
jgi:hypothetical protein